MTGKSHLVAGTAVTAATLQQAGYPPSADPGPWLLALAIGLIASLLPDSDSDNPLLKGIIRVGKPRLTNSLISRRARRRFPTLLLYHPLALIELLVRGMLSGAMRLVSGLLPHRGPTHYLITAVTLTGLVWLITHTLGYRPIYALAFGAGYLSHIWGDTMTKRGVQLLAPLLPKHFHALPRPLRLTTGRQVSIAEIIILILIGLGCSLAFIMPPASYLPLAAGSVGGMFVLTAVFARL